MTYKDNFVVEVKCNGKIMRVRDGAVHLPYGSEYTLLLKNLNSRKASIKIHIDGQDVLDYSSLILQPNSTTELEGFLSNPEIMALIWDLVPRDAMAVSPRMPSAKYSVGPNVRAISAKEGVTKVKPIMPKRPPSSEDTMPVPNARPAWPFLVIS